MSVVYGWIINPVVEDVGPDRVLRRRPLASTLKDPGQTRLVELVEGEPLVLVTFPIVHSSVARNNTDWMLSLYTAVDDHAARAHPDIRNVLDEERFVSDDLHVARRDYRRNMGFTPSRLGWSRARTERMNDVQIARIGEGQADIRNKALYEILRPAGMMLDRAFDALRNHAPSTVIEDGP